jgi:long-subunit acyl-CoA synthetase (AMP-forming)
MALQIFAHSLYEDILHMESLYADRVAIQYYDEDKQDITSVLYRQYAADIRRCVRYLQQNIPDIKGKHISILAKNSYHYVVSLFAVNLAGAVLVPLNIAKSLDEICYELDLADVDCILHDGSYLENEPSLTERFHGQMLGLHDFVSCTELAELQECDDMDALAFIMFTSGTTGRSKGVMLSMRNLFASMPFWTQFDRFRAMMHQAPDYQLSIFSPLPLFHASAFTSTISWSLAGNTINLCNDLKYYYRDLKRMSSDVTSVVPMLLKSLHQNVSDERRKRLGKLCGLTCAGAMFDPAMLQDMISNGFIIMQYYGMTETFGGGTQNLSQLPARLGSVGELDPAFSYKLDNGELCLKGDAVMLGYYKDPEATAEVIDADGWLHTGDLVRVDEERYVFITGRKKNLIILSSGENVSPEELENLLAQDEDIAETLVKEKGDKICAVIRCDSDKQESIRAFVTELNRTLPLYKRITAIEFSDEPLPRNASGKLLRT